MTLWTSCINVHKTHLQHPLHASFDVSNSLISTQFMPKSLFHTKITAWRPIACSVLDMCETCPTFKVFYSSIFKYNSQGFLQRRRLCVTKTLTSGNNGFVIDRRLYNHFLQNYIKKSHGRRLVPAPQSPPQCQELPVVCGTSRPPHCFYNLKDPWHNMHVRLTCRRVPTREISSQSWFP